MNLTKFEAAGIAFSIGAMVLTLGFLRLENTNDAFSKLQSDEQDTSVFIADSDNQRAAVADALLDASDGPGNINKLIIDDVIIGDGDVVEEGDTVTVHYIGTLQNGQQFDNSYVKGEPFSFTVGDGRVIEGWERGVVDMREGGQRILVIPPRLAYGDTGSGPIPADATLVFAIELLSVEK